MTGPVEIAPPHRTVIAPQFRIVEPTQSTALAVAAPVEVVPPAMQAGAIVPQFDNAEPMARNRTDVVVTTPSASAPAVAPQSNRTVSTSATPATRSTAVTAPATAAPAVSAPASNSVSISTGNVTPAVGNAVEAPATSNPSFGNPTPAFSGNPTPAFSSNPTPIGTQTNTAVTSGTRTTVTVR
jgi:DamX protein